MKKITMSVIIIISAVFVTQVIIYALSDVVQIKLRQHTFLIPKHIAMERNSIMPDWLINMSGLDDGSNSTLFRFDDQAVKASVESYQVDSNNPFADDIEVLMMALTPQEVSNYKNPNTYAELGDLWQGIGSYENRKIEPSKIPGWYKVYRAIEYPRSWMLINQFPDSAKNAPAEVSDFLVVNCLMLGPTGNKVPSCGRYELMDNIVIEFRISDYNLPLLDEISEFLKAKVLEWKQNGE